MIAKVRTDGGVVGEYPSAIIEIGPVRILFVGLDDIQVPVMVQVGQINGPRKVRAGAKAAWKPKVPVPSPR